MNSLVGYIRTSVNPKQYWETIIPGLKWLAGGEARIKSPMRPDDKTPSFYVNAVSGAWFDHGGSKSGGNSIVSFHAELHGITKEEAALQIFEQFVHPVIDDKQVRAWARLLRTTPSHVGYVKSRFVSAEVAERVKLGSNGDRIVFPIFNEFGVCVNAKFYKQGAKPKMLSFTRKGEERPFGSPSMLFPLTELLTSEPHERVIVTEGEWDALALNSIGILAVSSTNGCKSWPKQYNELFRGREVIIAYDNDEEGEKNVSVVVKQLVDIAKVVKHLKVPKAVGKDVSDWIKAQPALRKPEPWEKHFKAAEVLVDNPDSVIDKNTVATVPLDQASKAEWLGRRISVEALVTGKDTAPYILPRRVRVTCSKKCEDCPLAESGKDYREKTLETDDDQVLGLIDATKPGIDKRMALACGLVCKPICKCKVETVEAFNVEQVVLIPTLDDKHTQYVTRRAFYVGHGLKSNSAYRLDGRTFPDPQDQHAVHLFSGATPVQGQVETFELTRDVESKLKRFQPRKDTAKALTAHLNSIAEWQSRHLTKIVHRNDLHIAVDLVFHSVQGFEFNGEKVNRGMLDALVLGDTRAGKGFVTQGLVDHYGLGEVASGENCSFAGLIGGCESVGKRFIIKWGIVPLNNGRLVVVDEASAIPEADWGRFSRVRSEGVAEINKIIREQTRANARLLWLANPRSGRPITSYSAGVQAIKELVGANEDVARFDFAITVASNEVDPAHINQLADYAHDARDAGLYPRDVCRSLVLWAWSRKPGDVKFTPAAVKEVIEQATVFGRTYSPMIPLVQAENIRIKLAKLAAAVAARVFSTEDGRQLIVQQSHVQAACQFLREWYSKPSMGYETYSTQMAEKSTLTDGDMTKIAKVFDGLGDKRASVMRGLLALNRITADGLTDFTGDGFVTRDFIASLVVLSCLTRAEAGNWYLKNPAFSSWLRDQQRKK